MTRIGILLLALCSCLASPPQKTIATKADNIEAWLRDNAVPLSTTTPSVALPEAINQKLQQAQWVGMGEATHGTKEFFDLKHRFFRSLVKLQGFTVLAMELEYESGVALNTFIQTGQGDLQTILEHSFFFMQSSEISALIRWMRSQAQNGRHLRILGFDTQGVRRSATALERSLLSIDPAFAEKLAHHFAIFKDGKLDPSHLDAITRTHKTLEQRFLDRKAAYAQQLGRDGFQRSSHRLRLMTQALSTKRICHDKPVGCYIEARDFYMAENAFALVEGRKALVWGHNGHIAGPTSDKRWANMGSHIRAKLGTKYYAIAFEFNEGSFITKATKTNRFPRHTLGPAPAHALAAKLALVQLPLYFLPLE